MATQTQTRLALRPLAQRDLSDGAWWPQNRRLSDQLGELFAMWPPEAGRIYRVLYSSPDWDDRPRAVEVPGRRVKTGTFPSDDTHRLVLSMSNGQRRMITVIPPDTPDPVATEILADVSGDGQ